MTRDQDPRQGGLKIRVLVLGLLILAVFLFYIYHLFSLQIVENLIWEGRARAVSSRSQVIPAQRGRIWDRNVDFPLAVNIDSFSIGMTPAETGEAGPEAFLDELASFLPITSSNMREIIPINWQNSYNRVELIDGIPYETVVDLAERSELFPGVDWQSKPYRWYNVTGSIAHILGFVGNITTEELQLLYNSGYLNTSNLGKSGVEKSFDTLLRGSDGRSFQTVDVRGRRLASDEALRPPENGLDLVLTLDRDIQELAEKALGPRKGAVVVLRPSTGEVLALVSYPSFDPNRFREPGPSNFGALSLNTDFPFLNRSIQTYYAPASTFKIVVAAALLAHPDFDPLETVTCTGTMRLGDRDFRCHKRSGHGPLDLRGALEESCNIYFGTMGVEVLGIDAIASMARSFGLGSLTGIDIGGETSGIVPGRAWKEEIYNSPWTGGDTLNVSVGQGFMAVTPLQMANVMAAISNDGVVYRPHVLMEVRDPTSGQVLERTTPEVLREIEGLAPQDYQFLREALRGVVTDGTGRWALYTENVDIGGKTGTGEVGSDVGWHDWFVALGPIDTDDPSERIVVVAMAEASDDYYDWWTPKAVDIIYEGIFDNQSFESVIEEWQRRQVWWSWDTKSLPLPGEPYVAPVEDISE